MTPNSNAETTMAPTRPSVSDIVATAVAAWRARRASRADVPAGGRVISMWLPARDQARADGGPEAKPTIYGMTRFRSRLEARWARFFDLMEVPWDYEPWAFNLADGRGYIPDFWLPQHRVFVEVKPIGGSTDKAQGLAERYGHSVWIAEGHPRVAVLRSCTAQDPAGRAGVVPGWRRPAESTAVALSVDVFNVLPYHAIVRWWDAAASATEANFGLLDARTGKALTATAFCICEPWGAEEALPTRDSVRLSAEPRQCSDCGFRLRYQ
jgi:hypothetical protein